MLQYPEPRYYGRRMYLLCVIVLSLLFLSLSVSLGSLSLPLSPYQPLTHFFFVFVCFFLPPVFHFLTFVCRRPVSCSVLLTYFDILCVCVTVCVCFCVILSLYLSIYLSLSLSLSLSFSLSLCLNTSDGKILEYRFYSIFLLFLTMIGYILTNTSRKTYLLHHSSTCRNVYVDEYIYAYRYVT